MELYVPSADDVARMSPEELRASLLRLEIQRRKAAARLAVVELQIAEAHLHEQGVSVHEGWAHTSKGRSKGETAGNRRLARAFRVLPKFAEASLAGRIGVEQMHEVANVVANPCIREFFADPTADELLTSAASELQFDNFVAALRTMERKLLRVAR